MDTLRDRTFVLLPSYLNGCDPWLSQGNHLFTRLHITTNLQNYGCVEWFTFEVHLVQTARNPPPAYLFLCPPGDVRSGPYSYRWPKCPAYWTLDPSGIERLTTEEATQLGLPLIKLETEMFVSFWDGSVYAGLRQFHQGKGFDPDSQDVARHLGHPLYQLTGDMEAPFAHLTVEPQDFWSDDKDWNLGFADREPQDLRNLACMNNAVKTEETHAEKCSHREENPQTPSVQEHGLPMHDFTAKYGTSHRRDTHQSVSSTFNFVISVQLALILLAWLAAAVCNGSS
ncbi:hypothetical protein DFH06DRAFT_1166546 [Mycena polygramma]|nr:hypothetical protein DFH06DRAFT_1166546 [Mycena polygramma]